MHPSLFLYLHEVAEVCCFEHILYILYSLNAAIAGTI